MSNLIKNHSEQLVFLSVLISEKNLWRFTIADQNLQLVLLKFIFLRSHKILVDLFINGNQYPIKWRPIGYQY